MTEENEIKTFTDYYSTFFEEFKSIGISTWIFYLLYILRRLIIVFSINFIQDGLLQLSIAIVCSLTVR